MKNILVIEDNLEVREILEEVLELSGYEVRTAENGSIGVKKAMENPPDLILCDIMMPKLDGYGVLNILSKKPATANVPFVFLTAKNEKEDFRRGMNLGADDYITKPFYKDELLQVIETRLKKSERLNTSFDGTDQGLSRFIDEAKGYEALQKLSEDRRIKTYKAKEAVFYESNYPKYLYFIKKGKVKLTKTNEYGKELIISVLNKGAFLGYTALIAEEKYSYGATSMVKDTELSLIPKDDFFQLLFANKDVSSRLIKMLANNVINKEGQLLDLAYSSVRKRVANAVVALYEQQQGNHHAPISILRDDLARIVGTAKESVIRMLTEFKEDGYIAIEGGAITVLELWKLKELNG
jgi:CheY-like chemotaxis protein/CRP-like cAMP-binding protein